MHTYHAALLYGREDIRLENVSISSPEENEVLVQIRHIGICPTDLKKYLDTDGKYTRVLEERGPYILGHEASGVVLESGEGADEYKKDDEVSILPVIPCGSCSYCRSGEPQYCTNLLGIGGSAGEFGDCVDLYREKEYGGCYAQLLKVPKKQLSKVPEDIPLDIARLLEPVADVVYSVEMTSRGSTGVALIIGLGPMGLFHIPVLKALGVETIIGSDPKSERREVAKRIGAAETIDPLSEDLVERVKQLTDGMGVQQTYVACGGPVQSNGVIDGLNASRKGGVVNSFASLYNGENPQIDINYLHYNHLSLVGTVGFHQAHIPKTFNILRSYKDDFAKLIYPVYSFEHFQDAIDAFLSQNSLKVGVDL